MNENNNADQALYQHMASALQTYSVAFDGKTCPQARGGQEGTHLYAAEPCLFTQLKMQRME